MAFQFSLAAVWHFRKSRKEQEKLRLQNLLARRAALAGEMQQARNARLRLERSLRRRLEETMTSAADVQMVAGVCAGLERRQQQLQAAWLQVQTEIAAQAERYRAARQEHEVVDALRQLRLGEYRLEQQRREQAALDELFLLGRVRKRA